MFVALLLAYLGITRSFQVEGEVAPVDINALAQYSTPTLNLLLRPLQGERDQ